MTIITMEKDLTTVYGEAFKLWVTGVPEKTIASKVGKHANTIRAWRDRDNWQALKDDVIKSELKAAGESEVARKDRLLKITKAIQVKYVKEDIHDSPVGHRDVLKSIEVESKLTGLDINRIQIEASESLSDANRRTSELFKNLSKKEKEVMKKIIRSVDGDSAV